MSKMPPPPAPPPVIFIHSITMILCLGIVAYAWESGMAQLNVAAIAVAALLTTSSTVGAALSSNYATKENARLERSIALLDKSIRDLAKAIQERPATGDTSKPHTTPAAEVAAPRFEAKPMPTSNAGTSAIAEGASGAAARTQEVAVSPSSGTNIAHTTG